MGKNWFDPIYRTRNKRELEQLLDLMVENGDHDEEAEVLHLLEVEKIGYIK